MPDIGLIELILIGIVAFLVLGPERMPEFLGQISRMVRRLRQWVANIKQQIDQETQPLQQPIQEITQAASKDVHQAIEQVTEQAQMHEDKQNAEVVSPLSETSKPAEK